MPPSHLRFAAALAAGLLLAGACSRAGEGPGEEKPAPAARPPHPHVVLFLADDLGWQDVGWHGAPFATPRLDRLAEQGVRLQRCYVMPVCSPTRAALMTGRHPVRDGFVYGPLRPWDTRGLDRGERLMPEYFRAAGYRTVLVGKWHLGHSAPDMHPNARGFDHFYGCLTGAIDYFTHERGGAPDWQRNGRTVREEGYATDLLAAEAVRIIRGHDPAVPLFLELAFTAPHTPLEAPEERIARHADIPGARRRVYAAMVEALDDAVGAVLDALAERGMLRDSVILFLSDNGASRTHGGRNLPLRGGKATTWEGGIRVPAVLWVPGRLEGGGTSEQVLTAMDVLPTLAAAAGVPLEPPRPLDGRDLWPALRDGRIQPRDDEPLFFAVMSEKQTWFAVLQGRWKLLRREPAGGGAPADALYDVFADPAEEHDLAAEHPELVRRLAAALETWRARHPGTPVIFSPDLPEGWEPPADWAAWCRAGGSDRPARSTR